MVTPSPKSIDSTSRWPSRLARWTLYAAIPLVLFGGTVTTMRAGMAEDGWWTPDGHLLWLYPWAMRIRNAGVFVEHHHRELGSLVGLLSLVTVIATWCFEKRWGPRLLALAGLTAVSVQGAIGGFRVLENDPQLAFLHGALGQAVFTLLAVVAIGLSSTGLAVAPLTMVLVVVGAVSVAAIPQTLFRGFSPHSLTLMMQLGTFCLLAATAWSLATTADRRRRICTPNSSMSKCASKCTMAKVCGP